ncbi:hypothetical protein CCR85_07685 [Rhodothalassium salexigens]|uniref:hypothetical protein n=2 Tax=Rhodothalassium salexigens TaxID=1086 RepID=UPI001912ECB5|nr:hypothetical protein [Rhodothalassium salexigens]MBK5911373.1 hypothetical protein [Rhodothalassium salexigens]
MTEHRLPHQRPRRVAFNAWTYAVLVGLAWLVAGLAMPAASAEPTDVTVRVIAKGAKFIGSGMGGVAVRLEDADSGQILAQGRTAGTTGDTDRIMSRGLTHAQSRATPDAAHFTATLALDAPRRVRLVATGPVAQPQARTTVTATQWIVPGRHLTGGGGWVVEMPGLVVNLISPAPAISHPAGEPIRLDAKVMMMCGCPITPEGLWDAADVEVVATVLRDGEPVARVPLDYANSASRFAAPYTPERAGTYEVVVHAYQPGNGNTGLDRAGLWVTE